MSRQNKNERKRLKRKQKQLHLRKERGLSVYQQPVKSSGPMRCTNTPNWKGVGEASITVVREAPGGGRVFLGFLVDFWCVGLKDAFGRTDLTLADIDAHRERTGNVAVSESEVRRLIAGAVRFSRQDGFKLPHKYERYVAAAGVSLADVDSADLAGFGGPDGKLRYVGSIEELRRMLAGSVDDFLSRGDVEFVMGPGAFDEGYFDEEYEDDETDPEDPTEELAEGDSEEPPAEFARMMQEISDRTEAAVRRWLVADGQTPHPRLVDGIDVVLAAAMVEWTAQDVPEARDKLPDVSVLLGSYDDPEAVAEAVTQVTAFVKRFESPQRFLEAMGMRDEEQEEEVTSA
jgi:hypothetical protein